MQLIWVASINIAFKVTPFRLLKKETHLHIMLKSISREKGVSMLFEL